MEIVDVKLRKAVDFDGGMEVWQCIEFGLLRSPVEAMLPVLSEPLDIRQRSTVVPCGAVKLLGSQSTKRHLVTPRSVRPRRER